MLKSRIFKALISCILVLSLAMSVMVPAFAAEGDDTIIPSTAAADEMMDDWMDAYLLDQYVNGERVGLSHRRWTGSDGRTDFWLSAIVFDSFNDALEYGSDEEYKEKIKDVMYELYLGFYKGARTQWGVTYEDNTYNDDLCWWAMCLERAYELTGVEEYLSLAKACIDRVLLDYDETNAFGGDPVGGILWRWSNVVSTNQNSKDMCANGNTSLVCARFAQLYAEQGDTEASEHYAEYAKKIYDWIMAHLYVEGGNGRVINCVYYNGSINDVQFTYNNGVCAGAAYELYNLTGKQEYLDTAIEVMQYAFNSFTQDGLTIKDEGTGDSAGFKTIMLRVAADMYRNGDAPQFEEYIVANAYQAWRHRRESDGLIGSNIRFTPGEGDRLCSPCAILGPSLLYWANFDPNAEYDFDFSGSTVPGRYEAELAQASNVQFQSDGTASMGQTVQYWDADNAHNATGYVKFTVDAKVAGEYNIKLVWKSRNQNGTRHIQVNDGPDEQFSFPAGNDGTYQTTLIPATLNKGENTIKVSYWNNDLHANEKDTQSWWFLDYLELELVQAESSTVVSTDKTEYEAGEDITFTINTDASVTRVGIANENGKLLGKKSQLIETNEDGTLTWTIVASIATKGERTVSVYMDNGDSVLTDTGETVDLVITEPVLAESDDATIKEAVKLPETAKKNEAFTVTVVTGTGVNKIGIFNEDGKALGKLSQTYVDEDGTRTWTISISVGSRGERNLTVKTADAAGNWVAAEAATIVIK